MKHQEHIFAIPAHIVPKADTTNLVPFTVEGGDIVIAQRFGLETNPNFRQILPYVLVECGGKLLCYQRTKGIGEDRLLGKHSIGIGGHIDLADICRGIEVGNLDWESTYYTSIMREVQEEICPALSDVHPVRVDATFGSYKFIDGQWLVDPVSVERLRTNLVEMDHKIAAEGGVEAVHLGCPLLISVSTEEWDLAEDQLILNGFMEPQDILDEFDCERWTEILLEDYLYHKIKKGGELSLKEWFEFR